MLNVKIFERYKKHYQNDHSLCKNCKSVCSKYLDITKTSHAKLKLINKISSIFDEVLKNSEKYVKLYTTSIVESINRSINPFAPKDINYAKTYDMRVDNTLGRLTNGEKYVQSIFEKLNLPLCN